MKRIIALVLSLIMALSLCAPAWGVEGVEQAQTGGAVEVATADELVKALNEAADAGSGDSTVALTKDIDLKGVAWTPISVDGYHGAGVVTLEGNNNTITGLSAPLFAGGFAGKSGIVINDLTIANSTVVCTSDLGGGAFIDSADSMHIITLDNCHLINSSVSGERAGGLIGWCSGYAKLDDGPVKAYVTIKGCSVVDSTVTGAGSAGAIAGHPGASDYTYTTIENCIVKNVDVISNDDGSWRTGAVVGTANNGHIVINNVTVEDVTLTQNGVVAEETLLYGRFVPAGTGTLEIDGNLAGAVAKADGKQYMTLQEALTAGGKVVLLDNITLTEGVTVAAGKTVELDLAGKTISQTKAQTDTYAMITNKGTLTISDSVGTGKISYADTTVYDKDNNYASNTIRNEGVLNVTGGTIENVSSDNVKNYGYPHAIDVYQGSTTNISGGTVKSVNYDSIRMFCNSNTVATTVNISGGTIYNRVTFQNPNNNTRVTGYGILNITGGNFVTTDGINANVRLLQFATDASKMKATVTGGYFDKGIGVSNYSGADVVDKWMTISGGYFNTDPSAYCADKLTGVTSDKAGYLYMVGEKGETPAEVEVAAPEVTVDTSKMTDTEATIANSLKANDAIKLDTGALKAEATDVANDNTVTKEQGAEKLEAAKITVNSSDEVTIVVQPYFDIEIKDVVVEESGAAASSVTIQLDITPMYQTVATTATDLDDIDLDGNDKNAVVIGTAKKMTVTEPVTITIKIPDALVALATDNKLFVTHEASSGTYVYEANVDAQTKTATFTNPHGFSSFSIGAEDNTVAKADGSNYTKLDHALKNVTNGGTVTVMKADQTASVSREVTFTVALDGVTAQPTITPGSGYTLTKENVAGGVKYTVTKVTGGYYPWYPSTTPDKTVQSPNTFDAGIALYVGVSVIGAVGTVALGKKRED